jgi:hypothetical protein
MGVYWLSEPRAGSPVRTAGSAVLAFPPAKTHADFCELRAPDLNLLTSRPHNRTDPKELPHPPER